MLVPHDFFTTPLSKTPQFFNIFYFKIMSYTKLEFLAKYLGSAVTDTSCKAIHLLEVGDGAI